MGIWKTNGKNSSLIYGAQLKNSLGRNLLAILFAFLSTNNLLETGSNSLLDIAKEIGIFFWRKSANCVGT